MQKLLLKRADASVNQVETTKDIKETVESGYLALQKIHNYIKLPPASFWSEHPPIEKSNNVINLIIAELEEQRSLLNGINVQIERKVKAQELVIGDLETKIRLINSQAEVQQAWYNLTTTEIEIELNELKRTEQIKRRLDSKDFKTPREHRQLIEELNRIKGKKHKREFDLLLEQQKLEKQNFELIREAQEKEEARAIHLLDLKLKRQKIAAQKAILEKQIFRNQADVTFKEAQENALKARQIVIQTQTKLDQASESGNEPKIKNTEKLLKRAKENLQRRLEAVNLASQKVEFAQQSLVEAQRQFEIETELEINARTTLDLQQQTNQAQRDAEDRASGRKNQLEHKANSCPDLKSAV